MSLDQIVGLLQSTEGQHKIASGTEFLASTAAGFAERRAFDRNADLLRTQAGFAESQGARDARLLAGEQFAAFGASGVGPTGTPQEVVADSAAQIELQAARTGMALRLEAESSRRKGISSVLAGLTDASSTLMGKSFEADKIFRKDAESKRVLGGRRNSSAGTSRSTNPFQSGFDPRNVA